MKSMTGFGTHTIINDEFDIKVDIKSVNNRYLDV
ncbi:MAG: YicC family protein, partial [Tissierellia bacterium]|nr:YicC family protein [Tissierellia bacterium]